MRHEEAACDSLNMEDRGLLLLVLCLCSSGLLVEGTSIAVSTDLRLVTGVSHCSGRLETNHTDKWWQMVNSDMVDSIAFVCRRLNCGTVMSSRLMPCHNWRKPGWCDVAEVTCSESIRLVNGSGRCSGRLEVKSNQSWSPVCEGDFDHQDAQVLCRELDCGTPTVLQGALFGVETHDRSSPARNSCAPVRAVELTCSDSGGVMLVGGANQCSGELQLRKHGVWSPVKGQNGMINLKVTNIICRWLDCGSTVSTKLRHQDLTHVWRGNSPCFQNLRTEDFGECISQGPDSWSYDVLDITCSESFRLVNGSDQCSGRLEVKTNQSWSSVCETDFDQQAAHVVCEELGCGPPSIFYGGLFGKVEAPVWSGKFWCEENEPCPLDYRRADTAINMCSPDQAVGITCSDPFEIRLVGGSSRCSGKLEMKHDREWRPVTVRGLKSNFDLAKKVCSHLDCGSAVSTSRKSLRNRKKEWSIKYSCIQRPSHHDKCEVMDKNGYFTRKVVCTGLLTQPNITISPYIAEVSTPEHQTFHVLVAYDFNITCSTQAQYKGGTFQLLHNSSNTVAVYTQPAVNHSAHFHFSAAHRVHQGDYTCVYSVHAYSRNLTSQNRPVRVIVSALLTELMIRLAIHLLFYTGSITALCVRSKRNRRQRQLQVERGISTS